MHGICKSKLTISNLNRRISAFDITAASRHDLARAGRLARHCSSRAAGTPWNNCSSKKRATKMAEQTHHTPNKTLWNWPNIWYMCFKGFKELFSCIAIVFTHGIFWCGHWTNREVVFWFINNWTNSMTNTWNVESLMQMSTVIWRSGKNKCWVDNLRAEYLETDSTGLYVIIEKTSGFTIAAAPHFCARHELSGRIKRSSNVDMLPKSND